MASKVFYSVAVDLSGVSPDTQLLAQQIVTAGLHAPDYINVDLDRLEIDFAAPLSPGDKTTLDGVIAAHPLAVLKARRYAAIDARTRELIVAGFVSSGKTFSLSIDDFLALTAFDVAQATLSYPIEFNTKDNTDAVSITRASDLHAFYLSAVTAYRASLDSGTALKDLIRAAKTVADVNAIVDTR